jgi:creatinine amidohydrolase
MLNETSTGKEIEAARPSMAVFGIGAIEQHGRHLPIATDWLAVAEISRRVAQELEAFLIPSIPYSMSECHGDMEGTVWLKPATLSSVLHDVAVSLREQGIKRLLVLNGHGGNFILEPTIQALNKAYPDFKVVMPMEVWAPADEAAQIFRTASSEIHAGEVETSTQLFLNPEDVRAQRVDYVPPVGREFLDYVFMDAISPDGIWGTASEGDAGRGQQAIESQVRAIVAFARQVFEEVD